MLFQSYYGQQQAIHLSYKVLVFWTRAIDQTITDTFLRTVKLCVLNQSASYWLLSYAFYSTFTLGITMKVDVDRI